MSVALWLGAAFAFADERPGLLTPSRDGELGPSLPADDFDQMQQMLDEINRGIDTLGLQINGPPPPAPLLEETGWSDPRATDAACEARPESAAAKPENPGSEEKRSPFFVEYDEGFVIRPRDKEKSPYELKINSRMQFRYTGFKRDVEEWEDQAGNVTPVTDRNDFEIERGRLIFSGFFLDPALQFWLQLDGDTDDLHFARFHDYWVNYEFSKAFNLFVGKGYMPGSREWVNGSTRTRFADRSMATTFFRPDRSVGVWAIGEIAENVHYRTMVGNTFNAPDVPPSEIDDQFAYASSLWWDPLGDYGQGFSDLECHRDPVLRIGSSFTYASQHGKTPAGNPLGELNFVRLSDGTLITTTGALGPGATIDGFDVYLLAFDFAGKYCGFSFNSEIYLRQLNDFSANAPLDHGDLFATGFDVECGYFLIPERLELNGRVSKVDGRFGDGKEYAGGVNWFINGTHNNKLTFDVTSLSHNPANNTSPNLRAGDDGILFRAQWQVAF